MKNTIETKFYDEYVNTKQLLRFQSIGGVVRKGCLIGHTDTAYIVDNKHTGMLIILKNNVLCVGIDPDAR